MTEAQIKEKILELFELERQRPNVDFEESHFLDFLTFPAHNKNTVKNSFKGVRKYYKFMDRLELEFGICFSLSDLDKYYSVDKLTKKVEERINKRRGNLMILKQRNEEREKYFIEITLTLILVALYLLLGIHWLPIILTLVFGTIIYWILSSKINNRKHIKKLNLKILGKEK